MFTISFSLSGSSLNSLVAMYQGICLSWRCGCAFLALIFFSCFVSRSVLSRVILVRIYFSCRRIRSEVFRLVRKAEPIECGFEIRNNKLDSQRPGRFRLRSSVSLCDELVFSLPESAIFSTRSAGTYVFHHMGKPYAFIYLFLSQTPL